MAFMLDCEFGSPREAGLPGAVNDCRKAMGVVHTDSDAVWPFSDKEDREELRRSIGALADKIEILESEARKVAESQLRG
jgi:hypothetical protein